MALSYSAIIGRGKFNLPSVESWNTNNNIIRDPPRSIVAPRRDKVGSNSAITEEIEMSRDRIAECILAYPRGVNPMVGVSYNGSGNAGIHAGQSLFNPGQQAKLSYRVMMNGAFRPPILAPVDLLPLSRMPRLVTKVNCAVNRPDYQKKLSCEAQKNTYKKVILNVPCEGRKIVNVRHPSQLEDRRHLNTRKNPIAHNIVSGKSCSGQGNEREARGLINTTTKHVLAAQAMANPYQRREMPGAGINVNSLMNHVKPVLAGEISGAKSAPKGAIIAPAMVKGHHDRLLHGEIFGTAGAPKLTTTVPLATSGSCRAESFRAEMQPHFIIPRVVDTTRPEYRRTFGMSGVLTPDGGVYNVARH